MPAASTWATKAEVVGPAAASDIAGAAVWAMATEVGGLVTGDADAVLECDGGAILTE